MTALAVVAALGTTAAVVTDSASPEFPDLEGDWSGRNLDGDRFALHVAGDGFTFEVVGPRGEHLRCTGVVTEDGDAGYRLGTKEGVCGRITLTGPSENRVEWDFAKGPSGSLTRD